MALRITLMKTSKVDINLNTVNKTYIEAYFYAGRYKYHIDEDIDVLIKSLKDESLINFKECVINNFSQRTASLVMKELINNNNTIELANNIYVLK